MTKPKKKNLPPELSLETLPRLPRTPDKRIRAHLLGVGGVGANILETARNMSDSADTRFQIHDHDTVEFHNLNRTTLFTFEHLGQCKTAAAASRFSRIVASNNPNRVTEVDSRRLVGLVIDARDTLDPSQLLPNTWIKLAYDGGSNISFTWHPKIVAGRLLTLDDGDSYAVVPSFFVPAALLGVLALRFLEFPAIANISEENAGTVHLDIDQTIQSISHQWKSKK